MPELYPEAPQSAPPGAAEHSPAALIYAALLHNKLPLEEGFAVFDLDQDEKLSVQDVFQSCESLQLDISEAAIRQFLLSATGGGEFLDLQGWKQVLSAPPGLDAVLLSRGISTSDLPAAPAPLSVQEMLNIVKAALSYNGLTVEDGFHSFDVDQDGRISLADLETAVSKLQLGMSAADVRALHLQLDQNKTTLVELESWVALVGSADGETILMSRGVTTQQSLGTQGDGALYTAAEGASEPINVLAATLRYINLSPEQGYDAFDTDEDGKVSLQDLQASVSQLQMGIAEADIRALFASLEHAVDKGFIDKQAWVRAINDADTADILKSRGISTEPVSENVQTAINTIAAALAFNQLSPEDGYDAFDADEDGQVSLSDLQSAVTQLQLEISEQDSTSLFESLDADKTGFIPKAAWLRAMAGARSDDILKSRGVDSAVVTGQADQAPGSVSAPPAPAPSQDVPSAQGVVAIPSLSLVQASIDIVAASLVFDELSQSEGYDAFDADEDGQVSLADLRSAVAQLNLDISDSSVMDLFAYLSEGNTAISRASWATAMQAANATEVLKSRGVNAAAGMSTDGVLQTGAGVQGAINTIAAALVFNQLNPEDGYDAFDADEDGQVSLSDLQSAVTQLQLEISEQDSASLFESLDADKTGFIPKAAWLEAIAGANTEDILKSRGIALAALTEQGAGNSVSVQRAPVPEEVQKTINAIGAALAYNSLNAEDGYDAFDADEDGKVSLDDLKSRVVTLQLDLTHESLEALMAQLDPTQAGYISREEWAKSLADASVDEVLKSRGLSVPASNDNVNATTSQDLSNMIRALLEFNKLSPRSGYQSFDYDNDGKISLADLQTGAAEYLSGANPDEVVRWHGANAHDGYVELPDWVKIVEASDGGEVLRSRGIHLDSAGSAPSSQAAQTSVAALIVKALKYNNITVDEGFAEFDTDEDGFISTQDLMLTAKDLNLTDNLNSDQIMQWHAAANVSCTGKLDRSEWVSGLKAPMRMLTSLSKRLQALRKLSLQKRHQKRHQKQQQRRRSPRLLRP
jgi:Ca2+-binding EF-hand superfamily protein